MNDSGEYCNRRNYAKFNKGLKIILCNSHADQWLNHCDGFTSSVNVAVSISARGDNIMYKYYDL